MTFAQDRRGLNSARPVYGECRDNAIVWRNNASLSTAGASDVGFFLVAVGQILMIVSLHHVHSYAEAILPGWILIGMGFGFNIPTIIGSATHDLPAEQNASGSAVVNSARQIGGVFGASILVVILGSAAVTGDPTRYYGLGGLPPASVL